MFARSTRRFFSTGGQKKVGFLGMGNMGLNMTRHLVKNGFQVSGFDLSQKTLNIAESQGVIPVTSIEEAVKDADYVVTCLPRTQDVQKALSDPVDGVFKHAKLGTMILDTSTISPIASKELSAQALIHKMKFCDTPMSGGTPGAETGTLTFMVGAKDQAEFDQAKICLEGMGKTIIHCGGPGDGGGAKLVNNMILGMMMVATSEGLALGEKLGVDAKVLHTVLNASSSTNWCMNQFNPFPGVVSTAPSSRDYAGGFQTALIRKDLSLSVDAASEVGANVKITETCMDIFGQLEENGEGSKDFGIVFQHIMKSQGHREQESAVPAILPDKYKKYE